MRKLFINSIAVVCVLLLLVGCSKDSVIPKNDSTQAPLEETIYLVNDFSDATMTVVENTVSATGLTVEFSYEGDNECLYGTQYDLEVFKIDKWVKLPWTYDNEIPFEWTAIGYPINKGEPRLEKINWEFLYGELVSGHYRVIMSVLDIKEPGDYIEYYLASEFIIE